MTSGMMLWNAQKREDKRFRHDRAPVNSLVKFFFDTHGSIIARSRNPFFVTFEFFCSKNVFVLSSGVLVKSVTCDDVRSFFSECFVFSCVNGRFAPLPARWI